MTAEKNYFPTEEPFSIPFEKIQQAKIRSSLWQLSETNCKGIEEIEKAAKLINEIMKKISEKFGPIISKNYFIKIINLAKFMIFINLNIKQEEKINYPPLRKFMDRLLFIG